MGEQEFNQKLRKMRKRWESLWLVLLVLVLSTSGWFGWRFNQEGNPYLTGTLGFIGGFIVFLIIIKPINDYVEKKLLRGYWFQDEGDLVRVLGAVRMIDIPQITREAEMKYPGYETVENIDETHGCVLMFRKPVSK